MAGDFDVVLASLNEERRAERTLACSERVKAVKTSSVGSPVLFFYKCMEQEKESVEGNVSQKEGRNGKTTTSSAGEVSNPRGRCESPFQSERVA